MTETAGKSGATSARLGMCWTTYLGASHGVATAAGMTDLTLTEFAGVTGIAFQFFMHKHCDVSSVTVYDWIGRHQNSMERIGILAEVFHSEPGMNTYEAARKLGVSKIKSSIDRGVGVVAWAIDHGEFGVIHGYDDEDGVFLVDGVDKFNRQLGSDPMLYENLAVKFPPAPLLHLVIPIESVPYDRERAYRESLRFYVSEMERSFHMTKDYHSGLLAYDNWIHGLGDSFDPFGVRYATTVYAESKMFASEYARQLAAGWGKEHGLEGVVERFERIAGVFSRMMDVLEQDWNGAKHLGKPVTENQAKSLIPLLREAKQLDAEAVQLVKTIIG